MTDRLEVRIERWPIAGTFVISRGAKTEAAVVVAEITRGGVTGRGESVPYPRYGQTPDETVRIIASIGADVEREQLQDRLPASAARNAIDCALWDLAAKRAGVPVSELLGLPPLRPVTTCYTLSLDDPAAMAAMAARRSDLPLLKLKLGGPLDADRMRQVRAARPDALLVADANEGWPEADVESLLDVAAECGLEMVEQPLPAGRDDLLARIAHAVPVCADESAHATAGLELLANRYDAVNVKLDKTGGLTEALAMMNRARELGLDVMVGSMVSTSLSMAPAMIIAQQAKWVDLDSPLLLATDRPAGLTIERGRLSVPTSALWG